MFFCPNMQVPICIGWASILLLLILFCIPLGGIGILPSTEQICCRFCCLNNFFLINQYSLFDVVMFLQKNAGTDFYRLGEFYIAIVLLLHLLGLYTYLVDSRTNLLQVLLLIYLFFWSISTTNLLLLCFCRKIQVSKLIDWVSFMILLGHVYFWLSCMHVSFGPWSMCCVLVTRFSFFWLMHVNTWCPGKFTGHADPKSDTYSPPRVSFRA